MLSAEKSDPQEQKQHGISPSPFLHGLQKEAGEVKPVSRIAGEPDTGDARIEAALGAVRTVRGKESFLKILALFSQSNYEFRTF